MKRRSLLWFLASAVLAIAAGALVVWVDHALGGFDRWVPVNSDGRGLYGCHQTFEVGTDTRRSVTVRPDLRPDGWNVDCVTGAVTPGTDGAAAVAPPESD